MTDMVDFGTVSHRYMGTGNLVIKNLSFECNYDLAQFEDGNIRLHCTVNDLESQGYLNPGVHLTTFEGTTNSGLQLSATGDLLVIGNSLHFGNDGFQSTIRITNLRRVQVGQCEPLLVRQLRFYLTNFLFLGTQLERDPRGGGRMSLLPLSLNGTNTLIRQLPDYDQREEILKARRHVLTTCQAEIEVQSDMNLERSQELVSNLCLLLTIATGTLVSSVNLEMIAENGEVIYREHSPSVTKVYVPDRLIDITPPDALRSFIESAYPNIETLDQIYQLRRVVHAYADIKTSGFLETRGLTMVALMDYLAGRFSDTYGRTTIMDHKSFRDLLPTLTDPMLEILGTLLPISSAQAEEMGNNLQGLNWRSFRRRLAEICSHYEVRTSSRERSRFVDTRNELVHSARFLTTNPAREFRQMVHLTNKLLLRMFGYHGVFVNAVSFEQETI